ncbi:MAG: elongation factor EF-2 [Methanomassiliicoccales archaeon]
MGRKEDNIARASKIMGDPRHIRNIGTAAHIDHGKCFTGDALVFVSGKWISARRLFERGSLGKRVYADEGQEVYEVSERLETLSYDEASRTFIRRPLTHVWKIRNDTPLVKITTDRGLPVTVTQEHKFYVIDGEQGSGYGASIEQLSSNKLKPDMFLLAPPWVEEKAEELHPLHSALTAEEVAGLYASGNAGADDDTGGALLQLDRHKLAEILPALISFVSDHAVPTLKRDIALAMVMVGMAPAAVSVTADEGSAKTLQFSACETEVPYAAARILNIESCWEPYVYDFTVEGTHNLLVNGLIVHNTTLSDNLIAGAGMMSEELAGKQLMLDYDEQEQARGITINAANASMVHSIDGEDYLINLIDTPGHVDFGGDVTRAMRAIDGVIILVDAVEQVMPQTETVIRQALKERVKPILFVNKVDRLINELKVSPEDMQRRFINIINEVNKRIAAAAPEGLKKIWGVKVEDGTVLFGSAYNNWAISAAYMKKTGITFADIYKYLSNNDQKTLAQKIPLHKVVLESVVRNLPNPIEAQKLRIPAIWKGDLNSEVGKALFNVDPDGPTIFMVTKIIVDQHAGEVAVGRLFSGTLKRGMELYISGMPGTNRVQTVAMSVGPDRIPVEEIKAGNIAAVTGLKDAIAGSTVSSIPDVEPFEKMQHYSEPVVTVAIEAKQMKDLPRLIEVLRTIAKADPSITVEINQETGEHLLSGMGELHLDVTQYRIINDYKTEINASKPIVVYRESVEGKGGPFEGKSPNKHNRFYIEVEPLEDQVIRAIMSGDIKTEGRIKDSKALAKQLQDLGMEREEARGVQMFSDTNVFIDYTKGIQYLFETMELCKQAFEEAMRLGPLAQERCMGVKVRLVDAKLHEDSIHRGPAQVIPATRSAIYGAMCLANRVLYEPMQKIYINVPPDVMGDAIRELQQRRGVILDMRQEEENTVIEAKAPVSEMFGFASAIRSATQGRALWSTENAGYEIVPKEIADRVVPEIRKRKGLNPQPYDANYYAD